MAIPVELFRFRVVRNIQAQKTQGQKVINLVDLPTVAPTLSNRGGEGPGHTTIDPDSLDHWLTDLSTTLALRSDSVLPTDLTKLLPDDWAEQVGADGWRTLKSQFGRQPGGRIRWRGVSCPSGIDGDCRGFDKVATTASAGRKLKK